MSILLDAVTRAKQQDQVIDAVITPRAQYQQMNKSKHLGLKIAGFVALLLLAVGSAWLLSTKVPSGSTQGRDIEPVVQQPATKPDSQPSALAQQPQATSSVQLAGKVALPMAVARPQPTQQNSVPNRNQVVEPNMASGSRTIAYAAPKETSAQPVQQTQEPIILGANSNQRGQEVLNSLKQQVDDAALDVGLESTPQAQPVSAEASSNLLAAFEAALKEVEIENAVATPVTEAKLDPIPTPKPDELPKYGELPAGVQLQVPEFNILAHVYASDPNNRWLNVDGAELQQGDKIGGKLTIIEIRPRDVVLEVAGTEFKVPAI
ncbi:general secretion pathway protein GspB [Shewanella colwelliana]|uniref:general secretion pathway protein GspB n=1 Tax=Shewanella colwelliana TaxID=23 RepID=UPI0022AECFA1|nr:general secretion pathway protein GspB [Shewanella colwelliana]MCZ4336172.1 general secretion pathway protein GspB [Shewanella colwelliana]